MKLDVTEETVKLDKKISGHWAFDIGIEIYENKDKKNNQEEDKKEELHTKDVYKEQTNEEGKEISEEWSGLKKSELRKESNMAKAKQH